MYTVSTKEYIFYSYDTGKHRVGRDLKSGRELPNPSLGESRFDTVEISYIYSTAFAVLN